MKETIEKHSVKIQILTLLTLFTSVMSGTYVYATGQAEAKEERKINAQKIYILEESSGYIKSENHDVRISVMETQLKTQQQYLYNFKSEVKGDIKELDGKIDQVIGILLKH